MVNDQGIGDITHFYFYLLLVHRMCIFVPTDVLWQGGFPFEPTQSVGATVSSQDEWVTELGGCLNAVLSAQSTFLNARSTNHLVSHPVQQGSCLWAKKEPF